jgi:surface antigen
MRKKHRRIVLDSSSMTCGSAMMKGTRAAWTAIPRPGAENDACTWARHSDGGGTLPQPHNVRLSRLVVCTLALAFAVTLPPRSTSADPPPWAPAHGWRAKHGHQDDDDGRSPAPYGIGQLTCHRDVIGGLLGGAVGGLLGNQVGKGSGKTAATIGGAVVGVLVGGAIGRSMDMADQGCVAQVLEHARDRQAIGWANQGATYQVAPMRTFEAGARYCREYQTVATIGGRQQSAFGTACRQPDGSWQIVN